MSETTTLMVAEAEQLPVEVRNDLQASFEPLFKQAQEWKKKADKIKVTDARDKDGMAAAREARLELKRIRVEADKVRVKLKEESLLKGKAIDGMFNIIKFLVVPIETQLEEAEKFAELEEEKRLNAIVEDRMTQLAPFIDDLSIFNFRIMSDEQFDQLLAGAKKGHEAKLEAEKKAEEERLAKEKAEKEEQERIRKENEQLKIIQERMQKRMTTLMAEIGVAGGNGTHIIFVDYDQVGHKFEADKPFVDMTDAEFDKWVKDTKKQAQAIDAPIIKRLEAEEAEKKRQAEEAAAKLKAETEAREKAEAELKAKQEAEEKAKAEAEEQAKQAKLAPDKDKLRKVAQDLLAIEYPEMASEEGKKVIAGVKELMQKVNVYIVKNIENL